MSTSTQQQPRRGNPSTGPTSTSTSTSTSTFTSTTNPPASGPERSYFETHRAALVGEIAVSFEHVLANINKLNRSLEEVIVLGNEFSSVEALWSQFENVMAKDADVDAGEGVVPVGEAGKVVVRDGDVMSSKDGR